MIDIAISGLVKEFEVGKKILDGLTFQVDSGERVGLLGKNGCGKTTLLRILTGQLDWDEGEVVLAPDKRVGLISQIPVYPAGYTVEDVLDTAFRPAAARWRRRWSSWPRRMARGENPGACCAGTTSSPPPSRPGAAMTPTPPSNKVCNGLSIDPGYAAAALRPALRRGEDPGEPGPPDPGGHGHPAAGRAHQPPGPAGHRVAGGLYLHRSGARWWPSPTTAISWTARSTRVIEILDGKAEFYSGNYSFYAVEKERRYQEQHEAV